MDNPPNSRADAAYERALAAFQEKSYEVARRWVLEALAHNRQHAGARALLGRLDAARAASSPFKAGAAGSEVISTDPTVLISRASGQPPVPDAIEPTVMVRHDDLRRRPTDTDPRVTFPPLSAPRQSARPPAEPTIIAQSKQRSTSSRPKTGFSLGSALQSLGERLQRGDSRQRSSSAAQARSTGSGMSTPVARGALLAVATVAVGALLVWGLFLMVRWVWPAGQILQITKPAGGTIVGPGIECGTRGSRCSTTIATGEAVELQTIPDKDYVWSGYTGDCAPTGRTSMAGPRTCGATFDHVVASVTAATFRLTITKPEGGTVVGAGGILCGTNGSTCSADIPSGVPVSLKADSDDGYTFDQFTGDCPSTGETTMTSAKSCGVVFLKSPGAINRGPVRPPIVDNVPRVPRKPAPPPVTISPPSSTGVNPGPSPTQPKNPAGFQGPTPTGTSVPTGTEKPPPPPISADDHAKQEILLLVKNYCTALDTLKPATIRTFFHLDNERELKEKFKEYKSLKCTITAPPEYDRLDSSAAGGAQLKIGMKQIVEMRSGGAPTTIETIVTLVVSRKDFQSPWLIDRLRHEEKPK